MGDMTGWLATIGIIVVCILYIQFEDRIWGDGYQGTYNRWRK